MRGSCGQLPSERGRAGRWLRGDRTAEAEHRESKLYIHRWSHFNNGPHVRPQTAGGCSQAKPALDEEKAPCVPRACVRSSGESAGCGDGDPGLRRLPPRWHVLCAQSNALLPWVLPFPSLLSPPALRRAPVPTKHPRAWDCPSLRGGPTLSESRATFLYCPFTVVASRLARPEVVLKAQHGASPRCARVSGCAGRAGSPTLANCLSSGRPAAPGAGV